MSSTTGSSPSPQHDPSPPTLSPPTSPRGAGMPGPSADMTAPEERSTASTPDGVRASDAEREHTVAALHRALGEGRLDLEETESRVASTYASRFRHELPALTAVLPNEQPRTSGDAPTWSSIAVDVVWRARSTVWADAATERPSHQQMRAATAAAAVLWFLLCAVVAAGLVAA